MSDQKFQRRQSGTQIWRVAYCLLGLIVLGSMPGCGWMQKQIAGEGFRPWSNSMGKSVRGEETKTEHSGYFFDRKAQEIEENLGGGF